MSDVLVERAILGNLLREIVNKCRFCGCEGERCSTEEPGEKCVLIGELRNRCNGFGCNRQYWAEKADGKRKKGRAA